ncbi:MAG: hypothetical protein GXY23_10930 [Myxococcales bacterium]|nr:hypothetical protein [Myxococcales bacterium]
MDEAGTGGRADEHIGAIEDRRRATFQVVLMALVGFTVALVIGAFLQPNARPKTILVFYTPLFALYGCAALLHRAGRTRAAAFLTTSSVFAMVTSAVYFFGGLTGQIASAYFIVVIVAALTLGSGPALGFTALVVFACVVFVELEQLGRIPPPYHELTVYDHVASIAITVVLGSFLIKRALMQMESSLLAAARNERENLASLRALELATRALEERARRERAIRDLAEGLLMTSDPVAMAQCTQLAIASVIDDARTGLFTYARAERTLRNASPVRTVDLSGTSIDALFESVRAYQATQEVALTDTEGEEIRALVVSLLGRASVYGVLVVDPGPTSEISLELRDFVTTVGRVLGSAFERIHAERQLYESQRLEALGRLAGGIAHDFNNLLTVILGMSEVLMRSVSEEDRQFVAEIIETSRRAAELTEQLLTFSRRDGVEVSPIELDAVIESLSRILRRALGSEVELQLDLGAKGKHVVADRAGLEQVLMNLAVNARDAMPQGGRLRISTRASNLGDPELSVSETIILTVEDEGVGMSEEVMSRAFEPFFTTKEAGRGTGLGLPTVYGIVTGLGGRVEIDSAPGEGTRVRCIFPSGAEASRIALRRATPLVSKITPPGPIPNASTSDERLA